jgi:hypothetical protein
MVTNGGVNNAIVGIGLRSSTTDDGGWTATKSASRR